MYCQQCQTWNSDDDHRCRRCGRRFRSAPAREAAHHFPVTAAATAPAYDFFPASSPSIDSKLQVQPQVQQSLFPSNSARVIPFASLTSPAERRSIRAREAEAQNDESRPTPLQNSKVEVTHRRSLGRRARALDEDQGEFQFDQALHGKTAVAQSTIICDAPVATASARIHAAVIDGLVIGAGAAIFLAITWAVAGPVTFDGSTGAILAGCVLLVAFVYKLLWCCMELDSLGLQVAQLRVVDFDGHLPSRTKRFHRLYSGFISFLAAGLGLIWVFVDQDALTWHDHISSTFPTFAPGRSEE